MRITKVASNCGQHTTLAKYGANTVKQSIAVMLIMASMASKSSVHRPEKNIQQNTTKFSKMFNKEFRVKCQLNRT
ncbi:hypothetical protein HanXRQr2_Chr16g0754141 [Helianthus annuus]|uniref:Uncharacterized protein n=1 Tax=Helianthus annuus TaxID=4232 RepID=A0A9K3H0N9_HELAN|nr:hypothetical protein HanXRQr2_Chr16g0754141 [Helianthus annuus]KAJ0821661.1 hypothetical protein HanPSC8_Chr16g0722851 [Helianthus annuus]